MAFSRHFRLLAHRPAREFVAWCLPALCLGVLLRAILLWQSPSGIYHVDTPDFLLTSKRLLFDHAWELHSKKTFLVPVLFAVPFLLHLPALIFIPLFQNLEGLGLIVLVGLLCRLWFARWKLFIIPLTLVPAVDPFFLWFERTLMAETTFLFCTVLLALVGTLYNQRASGRHFALLCVALVLEAGARPEGKLLFGFGLLLLALVHGRAWRPLLPRLAMMLALAVATHFLTRTSQAGLLLYTSVARLTPADLKVAPGFDPYIAPIRADLQSRWGPLPSFPKVRDRRLVADAVQTYLSDATANRAHHYGVNDFCLQVATETCARNPLALLNVVYHKFRFTATNAPSGLFDEYWLFDRQHSAYDDALDVAEPLAPGLMGQSLHTAADFEGYVNHHYGAIRWFNDWTKGWLIAVNHFRFPDAFDNERRNDLLSVYFGIPYYFLIGGLGLVFSMFRRGPLQPVAIAWGLTLLGLFFTIMLTANTKPRFRFVFEPFWFIYIALLFDTLLLSLQSLTSRVSEPLPAEDAEPVIP